MLLIDERVTHGPVQDVFPGKVHLEQDTACWMCPGFNAKDSNGRLKNTARGGFKCKNCRKHSHARTNKVVSVLSDNVCKGCRDGEHALHIFREDDR